MNVIKGTNLNKEDKLMISKLRFSMIAVLMLVLFGFGLQDQAKGQPGTDLQFCPGVPFSNGWLDTRISPAPGGGFLSPDFSAGLIGTVEAFGGANVAGLDWMHQNVFGLLEPIDNGFPMDASARDFDFGGFINALLQGARPTNQVGAQLITWWSQKDNRNTYVQVTNYNGGPEEDIFGTLFVNVHVRILDENCVEVRNFCDTFTEGDTHVYNLGDLVTNDGQTPDDTILQGKEGFMVVTAVDDCPSPDQAIDYNFLAGTMYMLDNSFDYLYGINTYARAGLCFPDIENRISNGSFQSGDFTSWNQRQAYTSIATEFDFSPPVPVPGADDYQALVAADDAIGSNAIYPGYNGFLATNNLIGGPTETNVAVLQSNVFSVSDSENCDDVVTYDIQVFNPSDLVMAVDNCSNYTAVCAIDVDNPAAPFIRDCDCYNANGLGSISTNAGVRSCQQIGDDGQGYSFNATSLEFQGGKSGIISGELQLVNNNSYVIQVISGQKVNGLCDEEGLLGGVLARGTNGAVVDDFTLLCFGDECQNEIGIGENVLDGLFGFFLPVQPPALAGQFNVQQGPAAADVVHINFADSYQPNYRPLAARVAAQVGIWDEFEVFTSCGDDLFCFERLGVDAELVISEEFPGATPSPVTMSPVTPPTPPTPPTPETPTPSQRRGGSSGCAITGPVQLGTAMANVLIPLIPLAFAFGIRAVRRRKK